MALVPMAPPLCPHSVLSMEDIRAEVRQSLSSAVAAHVVLPLLELYSTASAADPPDAATPAAAIMRWDSCQG